MSRLSRRTVLKGAAGVSVALPLLRSLEARAEPLPPRRFLVFFHPNGVLPGEWFPTAGASEADFTISSSLKPLEPFREHVLILRGVDLKCIAVGPGEPHQRGMGALLTGRHLLEGTMVGNDGTLAGWASGISVDQRIAQELGKSTALGSLLLGVRAKGGHVHHHLSYSGPNQPLPVISAPVEAFDHVFSNFNGGDPGFARIRARRASVLDAVRGQLASVNRSLSGEDRARLEHHLTLVRDLETRLAATTRGEACFKPTRPGALEPDSETTMQQVAELQMDLMVLAFACDLTRVGTLQFSQAQNHIAFPWLESGMDGHTLSHVGRSDPVRVQIGWRDRWYAERFAGLLERLAAIPEGDGTLLDHTQILWVNELAEGNTHSQKNMPFVLAGHAAGFRMGRCVQYNGASHSDLLLSLLHGMGVDDPTFGNPDFLTGELTGLR
ncbi:MAG: DUF1552 domain-containing protein [Myxococcaceae bacterium]